MSPVSQEAVLGSIALASLPSSRRQYYMRLFRECKRTPAFAAAVICITLNSVIRKTEHVFIKRGVPIFCSPKRSPNMASKIPRSIKELSS